MELIAIDGDACGAQRIDSAAAAAAGELLLITDRDRRGERAAGFDPINHPA
jgi:hypothetical protein